MALRPQDKVTERDLNIFYDTLIDGIDLSTIVRRYGISKSRYGQIMRVSMMRIIHQKIIIRKIFYGNSYEEVVSKEQLKYISSLDISNRTLHTFTRIKILTIEDLMKYLKFVNTYDKLILSTRNLGDKSAKELMKALVKRELITFNGTDFTII